MAKGKSGLEWVSTHTNYVDAANSNPLITASASCLASRRLLNLQRHLLWHLGLLGQIQHLEPHHPCLPSAHPSRCPRSYSSCLSGVPQTLPHLCRHVQSCPRLPRAEQPGGCLFPRTCAGALLLSSAGTMLDTSPSTLLQATAERRRHAVTA